MALVKEIEELLEAKESRLGIISIREKPSPGDHGSSKPQRVSATCTSHRYRKTSDESSPQHTRPLAEPFPAWRRCNTKSVTNEKLVRGERRSRRSARFLSRHKVVDRRSNEQREHHCNQQPTDDRNGQQLQHLRTSAYTQRQRDHTRDRSYAGHYNRPQPSAARLKDRLFFGVARI